jgi:Phage tail-collar fibre protein
MTTQVTAGGIAAATSALAGGPKIDINTFKIGSSLTPPQPSDPSTDITGDWEFTGSAANLQYAVIDNNTVEYIVTLDESIGNFNVGRIGLFMSGGTLFSITALDMPNPDYKFSTSGGQVGDRLIYAIYISISNFSKITTFSIPLLPLLGVPEATGSEVLLPDPNHVAFNTSQVWKHSFVRVPVLAYRETPTQGWPFSAWFMRPERMIAGQGSWSDCVSISRRCKYARRFGRSSALTSSMMLRGRPPGFSAVIISRGVPLGAQTRGVWAGREAKFDGQVTGKTGPYFLRPRTCGGGPLGAGAS